MTDYLVMIRTTADSLATAGASIPDDDIVGYTLDGLDFNYIRIQSTLQLQPGLTFDELLSLLIREEDLIMMNQPSETPAALYARSDVFRSGDFGRNKGHGKGRDRRGRGQKEIELKINRNLLENAPMRNQMQEEQPRRFSQHRQRCNFQVRARYVRVSATTTQERVQIIETTTPLQPNP